MTTPHLHHPLLLVSAAVLGLAGTVVTATPGRAASSDPFTATTVTGDQLNDPFWLPPQPLPPGSPGDLIRSRPVTLPELPGVTAWQVLYRSTGAMGSPDVVSGTVLLPPGRHRGVRPLVGLAPGTQGMADSCATSRALRNGTYYELPEVLSLLLNGWAVAITDYQGLGTPGVHTYNVGRAEGPALLDILRAAQNLGIPGVAPSGPVALWGYSEGGGAAGWAAQLADTYAPDLHVVGVALGGVPTNLVELAHSMDGSIAAAALAFAAIGFDASYPDLDLYASLNANGRKALTQAENDCVINAGLQFALHHLDEYAVGDPLDQPDWQQALHANNLGSIPPTVPVFLYQGLFDEVVGYQQGVELRSAWCAGGSTVQFQPEFGEHLTAEELALGTAIHWFQDRFAGVTAPDNC
jgi:hypothetical protein